MAGSLSAPVKGALWMTFSACGFAASIGLIRQVSHELHPLEIVFFRNLFGLLYMAPVALRAGRGFLRTRRHGLYALRAVFGLTAMMTWFTAISLLPLAEAVALSFTTPIFTTILAALVLREAMRARRWAAVALGFLGTLVIVRPGIAAFDPASLIVIVSALAFATSGIIIKALSRTEHPNAIVTYMVIYLTPASLGPALWVWQTPEAVTFALLAGIGAATTMGHIGLTRAYAATEATVIQPFGFSQLPFAALIGYFAFGEVPGPWTWPGGAVIAGACLYLARRESVEGRASAASAADELPPMAERAPGAARPSGPAP